MHNKKYQTIKMKTVISKIKKTLKKARKELSLYIKKRRFSNLSKACENSWIAFNLLVEAKSGAKITGMELKHKAHELNLATLYYTTINLHILHNGSAALHEEEVIIDIREALRDMNGELRKFIYAQSKEGKMLKAITFDLDNTLFDFLKFKRAASDSAAKAMVKAGLKMPVSECRNKLFSEYLLNIEGEDVFQKFLKEHHQKTEKILAAGINAYIKTKYKMLKPYPKAEQTVKILKARGIKLALITDAPKLKAFMRLDAMNLINLFDFIIAFEDTGKQKPSKLPFQKALKLLKIKPGEAMHVGNSPERDIAGAKAVGMKTCLAEYGRNKEDKSPVKPDYKIKRISELLKIVEGI
jgi:HAD superfamily hydrolase (TIGR01509 family)